MLESEQFYTLPHAEFLHVTYQRMNTWL